jgi:putative transposase
MFFCVVGDSRSIVSACDRLYALQGLNLRPKMPHRKRAAVLRSKREIASKLNDIWAIDFMHERLADGSKIRLLTIVDLYSRECVALSVARTFKSPDVVRVLNYVCINEGNQARFAAITARNVLQNRLTNGLSRGT